MLHTDTCSFTEPCDAQPVGPEAWCLKALAEDGRGSGPEPLARICGGAQLSLF